MKHILAASMLVIGCWVASPAAQPQVTPVALPRTESFEFPSKINGRA